MGAVHHGRTVDFWKWRHAGMQPLR